MAEHQRPPREEPNVASGDDVVAVQAGRIENHDEETPTRPPTSQPAVTNVQTDNARVGMQANVVAGDVHITQEGWS